MLKLITWKKHRSSLWKFFLKITYIKNEFIYLLTVFIKGTAKEVPVLEIVGIQKLLLKEPKVSVETFYTYWLSSPQDSCRQTPLKLLYFMYFKKISSLSPEHLKNTLNKCY